MTKYSVANAKNNLSKLIDHALAGEGVVITRHGQPVVELKPVASALRVASAADIDWVIARRRGQATEEDAGSFVSRMRDEEWER